MRAVTTEIAMIVDTGIGRPPSLPESEFQDWTPQIRIYLFIAHRTAIMGHLAAFLRRLFVIYIYNEKIHDYIYIYI